MTTAYIDDSRLQEKYKKTQKRNRKRGTHMSTYIKTCSESLVMKESQTQTPILYSFSKPENLTQPAMGEDVLHFLPHNELLCTQ